MPGWLPRDLIASLGATLARTPHSRNSFGNLITDIGKDAVYEIADTLYDNKCAIESFLTKKETELYPGACLFLFDLTHAYFEDSALHKDLSH